MISRFFADLQVGRGEAEPRRKQKQQRCIMVYLGPLGKGFARTLPPELAKSPFKPPKFILNSIENKVI